MSHNLGTEVVAWFIHLPIIPNWRSHITKISQNRASTQHFLKFWKLHYFLLVISPANHETLYFSKKWKDVLCDTLHVFSCDSSVYVHCTHSQKGYTCVCGHDGGGLGKGRTLPWSSPNKCISFFCHRSFWLHAPTSDFFFCWCTNMAWLAKGINGPPLTILHAFYRPKVSTTLQRMQVVSILRCVIIADEDSSRLIALLCFPSLSFFLYAS